MLYAIRKFNAMVLRGGEEYKYHPSVPLPLVLYSNMIYEYSGVVLFINKIIYLNSFHILNTSFQITW